MASIWTKRFWKAAAERGVKTGAQFALLTIGVGVGADAAGNEAINAFALDYLTLGGSFIGGILVSGLTSLVTAKITDGSPSAGGGEHL